VVTTATFLPLPRYYCSFLPLPRDYRRNLPIYRGNTAVLPDHTSLHVLVVWAADVSVFKEWSQFVQMIDSCWLQLSEKFERFLHVVWRNESKRWKTANVTANFVVGFVLHLSVWSRSLCKWRSDRDGNNRQLWSRLDMLRKWYRDCIQYSASMILYYAYVYHSVYWEITCRYNHQAVMCDQPKDAFKAK